MDITNLDKQRINDDLLSGERVLWIGKPNSKLRISDFGIWLFAIPWALFSFFWEFIALGVFWQEFFGGGEAKGLSTTALSIVFPIFGMPFVLIGIYLLSLPIKYNKELKHTLYCISNMRLFKLVANQETELTSIYLNKITKFDKVAAKDGSGSLTILIKTELDSDNDRTEVSFKVDRIAKVNEVDKILRQAINNRIQS